MSTYVVPELVNADFTSDFDEMVINYISTKYNISDPIKTDTEHFHFKVGFFDFSKPYEIAALEQDTRIESWSNGGRSAYVSTGLEIGIRMKRLDRAGTEIDPQLGNMEREIIRIAGQYRNGDITGIKVMMWDGGGRVYTGTDTYAKSDWRSVVRIRVYYEKRDIS